MLDCEEIIQRSIETLKQGFRCVAYENRLCIVTPYLYPDNDLIELFVENLGPDRVLVSDLGETLRHLESVGLDLLASRRRRFILEQITQRTHVDIHHGKIEKEGNISEVGSLVSDIAAAAHCISDLIFTSTAYEPVAFPEEVSLYLKENEISHDTNYKIEGIKTGKQYRVSIRINGNRPADILVETLSPPQETAMTTTINRTFRKWYDINRERIKVSLLNDIDYFWKEQDIALLHDFSVIHTWSKRDAFLEFVKTA